MTDRTRNQNYVEYTKIVDIYHLHTNVIEQIIFISRFDQFDRQYKIQDDSYICEERRGWG